MKGIILILCLGFFSSAWADNLDVYKEVSDKFFEENVAKLNRGTLKQKLEAIDKFRQMKTRRALRPLISALRGTTVDGEVPTKDLKISTKDGEKTDDKIANLDLEEHNQPIIRFLASQAIAELYHEMGMKPMTEVYKQMAEKIDENAKVYAYTNEFDQVNAVNATGEILRSIGKLADNLELLEEDNDSHLKPNRTAITLGMETLKEAIAHKHYYIRAAAADGLFYSHRKEEALNILNSAVDAEKDNYAKAAMLSAIIGLQPGNSTRMMQLAEFLKDSSSVVRLRASQGLGNSGIQFAQTYLTRALQYEESPAVRTQIKSDIKRLTYPSVPQAPTYAYQKEGVFAPENRIKRK
ncbi:MAG: hypothetical protein QXO70_02950 [Candidatus Pacearchaeota archaeon]